MFGRLLATPRDAAAAIPAAVDRVGGPPPLSLIWRPAPGHRDDGDNDDNGMNRGDEVDGGIGTVRGGAIDHNVSPVRAVRLRLHIIPLVERRRG